MPIKIDGDPQVMALQKTRKTGQTQSPEQAEAAPSTDRVDLSAQVQDSSPTKRAARVQELKQQIAQGNYRPDMHQVATDFLAHLVREQ